MHAAPAVWARLDDGWPERVVITVLYGLTGAALAAWGWLPSAMSASAWAALVAAALALAGLGARMALWALPADADHLRWDGASWTLALQLAGQQRPTEVPVTQVDVTMDLGRWLMLRLELGPGGRRWQVARGGCVGHAAWHGLRVALRAHSAGGAPRTGQAGGSLPRGQHEA